MENKVALVNGTYGAAFAVHELNLSTGTGARAISGIHKYLGLTEEKLPGQEGSFAEYDNLEPGVYEIEVWLETQERESDSRDVLYGWNKRSPILIAETTSIVGNNTGLYERIDSTRLEVEIPYGYLALILLDETSKVGTTIAHIESLKRIGDLPYPVPVVFDNKPSNCIGSTGYNPPYAWANTGTGAKAASTLDAFMGWSDPIIRQGVQGLIPTVGSIITYNVLPGLYRIDWELVSSDANTERDGFLIWNGSELMLGGRRILADKPLTSTRFTSGIMNSEITVYPGNMNLAFIPIDTETTTGTTEIRIHHIERIGNALVNSYPAHTEILSDPIMMAITALNSFRNANDIPTQQSVPEPEPYLLESWQDYFQRGYNWYWHHLSPSGEDSSLLNQESHNFILYEALLETEFKEKFASTIGNLGLKTLAIFNYSTNLSQIKQSVGQNQSHSFTHEMYAFQIVFALYKIAAKIGEYNNIDNSLISTHIPQGFILMKDYLSQLNSLNVLPAVVSVFYNMKDHHIIPEHFIQNSTTIQSLWVESWGLD